MRTDLFYRICVVRIDIPPLRDRKPDVMILTDYFINHFNRTMGKSIRGRQRAGEDDLSKL